MIRNCYDGNKNHNELPCDIDGDGRDNNTHNSKRGETRNTVPAGSVTPCGRFGKQFGHPSNWSSKSYQMTHHSTPSKNLKEMKTYIHSKTCTLMIIGRNVKITQMSISLYMDE